MIKTSKGLTSENQKTGASAVSINVSAMFSSAVIRCGEVMFPARGREDSVISFVATVHSRAGSRRTGRGFGPRWAGSRASPGVDCLGSAGMHRAVLVAQAISKDGRYFVMIFADIEYLHPTPDRERILNEEAEKSGKLANALPIGRDEIGLSKHRTEEDRPLQDTVNVRPGQAQPSSFQTRSSPTRRRPPLARSASARPFLNSRPGE
jgi:hypothetical protein